MDSFWTQTNSRRLVTPNKVVRNTLLIETISQIIRMIYQSYIKNQPLWHISKHGQSTNVLKIYIITLIKFMLVVGINTPFFEMGGSNSHIPLIVLRKKIDQSKPKLEIQ